MERTRALLRNAARVAVLRVMEKAGRVQDVDRDELRSRLRQKGPTTGNTGTGGAQWKHGRARMLSENNILTVESSVHIVRLN